jgi:hypothetical protein
MKYDTADKKNLLFSTPWWVWVISIDIFLIMITVAYPHLPSFYGKYIFLGPFNLATENNIAAWWAGIGFLILSFLAFERFSTRKSGTRIAWLSLSLLLFALFCDEIGSFHERIGSWSRLLPFGLAAVTLLMYSLVVLFRRAETRKTSIFIFAGFFLFGTVAFQEYLEHLLEWPSWTLGLRTGIEEGTELAGTFLIFWGMLLQRRQKPSNSLLIAMPNLNRLRNIRTIMFCGLLIHIGASIAFVQYIEFDIGRRGNPLVLYPVAVYLLLCAESFRRYLISGTKVNRMFVYLSLFFFLSSVGSMYNLFLLLPGAGKIIPAALNSHFYSLHLLQLSGIALAMAWRSLLSAKRMIIVISALILFLSLGLTENTLSMHAALSGILSWLIAVSFLPELAVKRESVRSGLSVNESAAAMSSEQ